MVEHFCVNFGNPSCRAF